jgi:hypothetical protein
MVKSDDDICLEHDGESRNFNFHLLKADNELFNEESNKPNLLVSVKRIKLSKNGENWQILENNKVVLLLKGNRFTTAERNFLRSVDGMKFLIATYKSGTQSVIKFKEQMKDKL